MTQRILALTRGLIAFAALVVLSVGMPLLLIATVGNPYPAEGLSLTGRLTDTAVLGVVAVIGWIVWAQFVACVVIEIIAEVKLAVGRSAAWMTDVPGTFGGQQQLARLLVQAVVTATVGAAVITTPSLGSSTTATVAVATPLEEPSDVITTSEPTAAPLAHQPRVAPIEVTVAKGDTLWSLAERHLGVGERWREIADLNAGRAMGDDQQFSTAGTIRPGWRLLVPGAAHASSRDPATVVVAKGDTLWDLAEGKYGDGLRWPRLYAANKDQVADPDRIYPGQVLDVPRQRPPAPRVHVAPHPDPEVRHAQRAPTTTPVLPPPPRVGPPRVERDGPTVKPPAASSTADRPSSTHDETAGGSVLTAALTGGGALLGWGLLSVLLVRRRMQYRVRRSGRIVARTPAELVEAEAAIRIGGSQGLDDAEYLDLALRELVDVVRSRDGVTTLPDVVAARLSPDTVDLHLRSAYPTPLPGPWHERKSGLVLSRPRDIPVAESDSLAPYPTLVTVGTDETRATWLVDLEAAGIVHLRGETELIGEAAMFLVTELGVNVWSDHVALTVGQFAAPLIGLCPDRIRVVDDVSMDELIQAVHDVVDSCHVTGQDVLTGRLEGGAAEAWMPTVAVVIADDPLPNGELDRLASELDHPAGRKAVALVVVGGDQVIPQATVSLTVHHDGWMSIEPLGVKVQANRLSTEAAAQVATLVDHHRATVDEPMPTAVGDRPYEHVSDAAGALLEEHTSRRDADGSPESMLPQPDQEYVDAAATTSEDLAALAPKVPKETSERILALDPRLDDDLAAWHDPDTARPRIRMLGPVELTVADEPTGDARNRRAYAAEVVAYLAAHPQGATTEQLACEFDVKENVVHNYMAAARKWVGVDPITGVSYLPECTKTEAGRKRGMGVYQLVGVLSDEDLFRRLRVRAQARGSDGIDDLIAALDLVEGRPFDHLRKRGYGWLAETPLDHQLTAAIVDVAHIVATHCLTAGNPDTAKWAAEKAILAAPAEEKPKLDLATALTASGDQSADSYLDQNVLNRSDDRGAPPDLTGRSRALLEGSHRQS